MDQRHSIAFTPINPRTPPAEPARKLCDAFQLANESVQAEGTPEPCQAQPTTAMDLEYTSAQMAQTTAPLSPVTVMDDRPARPMSSSPIEIRNAMAINRIVCDHYDSPTHSEDSDAGTVVDTSPRHERHRGITPISPSSTMITSLAGNYHPAPPLSTSSAMETEPAEEEAEEEEEEGEFVPPADREFICVFDEYCRLGQYKLSESRKVVSDYFGRNKRQTRGIQDAYWLRMCRKHYQRAAYRDNYEENKLLLIGQQLNKILEQEPNLTFKIALKASEKVRLDACYARLSRTGQTFNHNDPAMLVEEKDKAPLSALHNIFAHCGNNKTASDCAELIIMVDQMLRVQHTIEHIPSFEMIPEFASQSPHSNNGRINRKGGVQRPGNSSKGRRSAAT